MFWKQSKYLGLWPILGVEAPSKGHLRAKDLAVDMPKSPQMVEENHGFGGSCFETYLSWKPVSVAATSMALA